MAAVLAAIKRRPLAAAGVSLGVGVTLITMLRVLRSRRSAAAAEDDGFAFDMEAAKVRQQSSAADELNRTIDEARRRRHAAKRAADVERQEMKQRVESDRDETLAFAKLFLSSRGVLEMVVDDCRGFLKERADRAERRQKMKEASAVVAPAEGPDPAAADDDGGSDADEWIDEDESGSSDGDSSSIDSYETDAGVELMIINEYERELRSWITSLMREVDDVPTAEEKAKIMKRFKVSSELEKNKSLGAKERKKRLAKLQAETRIGQQHDELLDWCKQYVETLMSRDVMVERARAAHDSEQHGPFDPNRFHSDGESDGEEGDALGTFNEEIDEEGSDGVHPSAFRDELFKMAQKMRAGERSGRRHPTGAMNDGQHLDEAVLAEMMMAIAAGGGGGRGGRGGNGLRRVSPTAFELHDGRGGDSDDGAGDFEDDEMMWGDEEEEDYHYDDDDDDDDDFLDDSDEEDDDEAIYELYMSQLDRKRDRLRVDMPNGGPPSTALRGTWDEDDDDDDDGGNDLQGGEAHLRAVDEDSSTHEQLERIMRRVARASLSENAGAMRDDAGDAENEWEDASSDDHKQTSGAADGGKKKKKHSRSRRPAANKNKWVDL